MPQLHYPIEHTSILTLVSTGGGGVGFGGCYSSSTDSPIDQGVRVTPTDFGMEEMCLIIGYVYSVPYLVKKENAHFI